MFILKLRTPNDVHKLNYIIFFERNEEIEIDLRNLVKSEERVKRSVT